MQSRSVLDHPKEIKKVQKKVDYPSCLSNKQVGYPSCLFLQHAKKQLEIPIKKERTRPTKIDV